MSFDIVDIDIDPRTNTLTTATIASGIILDIGRFRGTNPEFSAIETLGAPNLADLTMTLQYRVICTQGFCGSDCSQTASCGGFLAACPATCGDNIPCLNGGRCEVHTFFQSSMHKCTVYNVFRILVLFVCDVIVFQDGSCTCPVPYTGTYIMLRWMTAIVDTCSVEFTNQ